MRSKLLLGLFATATLSLSVSAKPNIVLFVSDDHGLDALGCYGNPIVKTPNMDRLAAEGVRFTQAYCTSASCAASRSVILTGKFGHATGSYGHVHDYHHFSTFDTVKSLPVLLEEAGYNTARIGKYHLAPESVYRFNTVLECDPRSAVEMAEACKEVIVQDEPFFLYFCPDDPHRGHPFTPDPWDAPNSFGNRPEGYPGVKTVKYDPAEVLVPPFLPDTRECRAELAEYYQSVSRIDQGLGKLQTLLKKARKADNTVIIYISDNGIAFPGAKTTVYEPGIKLPCIVKDPRTDMKGTVNDAMVSWVDLAPTILDFAGVPIPQGMQGRSLRSLMEGASMEDWRPSIYYAYYENSWELHGKGDEAMAEPYRYFTAHRIGPHRGVRTGRYKLIEYYSEGEYWELFDLNQDPNELKNLYGDPAYAALVADLKEDLRRLRGQYQDLER